MGLSEGDLRDWRTKVEDHLDAFGDVSVLDQGTTRRLLEWTLHAPGWPVDVEAYALFREYYRLDHGEWELYKYTYEYHRHGTRLAYHWHTTGSVRPVHHAHCGPDAEPEEARHLRATPLNPFEANGIFQRLYAADEDPDCGSFLDLEPVRQ